MSSSEVTADISKLLTLPTSDDLAPSIVFLVLYVISLPFLIYRISRKSDRTVILIRPSVFVLTRIVLLAIRAVMVKTDYGTGLLIAELVLLQVGFLFLLDPLIEIWKRHISSRVAKEDYPGWVNRVAGILRIALIVAIATGAAGGGLIGSAISDPSKMSTVLTLRKVSTVLSMAIVIIVTVAIIMTHMSFKLDNRGTGYVLIIAAFLMVVSVYRVVQTFDTNPDAIIRKIECFWILQILCEFVAYVLLIAISIPQVYPTIESPAINRKISSSEEGLQRPIQMRPSRY